MLVSPPQHVIEQSNTAHVLLVVPLQQIPAQSTTAVPFTTPAQSSSCADTASGDVAITTTSVTIKVVHIDHIDAVGA